MKKRVIIASNAICVGLILSQFGVWNSLMMFVLVGALPGTAHSMPPLAMFVLFIIGVIGVATGVVYLLDRAAETPKKLPTKRYNRV